MQSIPELYHEHENLHCSVQQGRHNEAFGFRTFISILAFPSKEGRELVILRFLQVFC
jgi:hypothetical protein